MKKQPRPPKSRRYCLYCERTTTFKYNPHIMHSECTECGCRIATSPPRIPP